MRHLLDDKSRKRNYVGEQRFTFINLLNMMCQKQQSVLSIKNNRALHLNYSY